jgi:hypothetical protein
MKILILAAMFCNMCVCLFLATGGINSDYLVSQNNKKKVHKEKVKKPVKTKGSCSTKKCSVA